MRTICGLFLLLILSAMLLSLAAFSVAADADCPHEFGEWVLTVAPTCVEKGEVSRTCNLCGEVQTAAVAESAHTESDWTLAKAPEVGIAGSMQKTCTVCAEVLQTQELAALPEPEPETEAEAEPEQNWIEIPWPVLIGVFLLPNLIWLAVVIVRKIKHKLAEKTYG